MKNASEHIVCETAAILSKGVVGGWVVGGGVEVKRGAGPRLNIRKDVLS